MTRYQPLLLWNGNFIEVPPYPNKSFEHLAEVARKIKSMWGQNVFLFYIEWDDDLPEDLPIVRRFSNRELSGEEEKK